MQKQDFH